MAWAVRSTYHTTLQATPSQLVFCRDMIKPLQFISEWDVLRKRRQDRIDQSNSKENKSRIDWDYNIGDKILLTDGDIHRKLDCPTKGPFIVKRVHANGTLTLQMGVETDRVNIRRCQPYIEA